MISLDCETTGLDLRHGAKPYLVTICDEDGNQQWWEWDVDPFTREPSIPKCDLVEIQEAIDNADSLVLQNPKFDADALQTVFSGNLRWDWSKVYCTLLAGHLLDSSSRHDLTSMALMYLDVDVLPYEDAIEQATKEARNLARKKHPDWRIAKKGLPEMPSAKETVWKSDMWLPRAVAKEEGYLIYESSWKGDCSHKWWTVCADYANSDSETTLALFLRQRELLKERNLWRIYRERLKLPSILYAMEERGITGNRDRLKEKREEYQSESERAGRVCVNIAKGYGYDLQLPKGSNNNSLKHFVFGEDVVDGETGETVDRKTYIDLPVIGKSKKTGMPSLGKDELEEYETSLPRNSKQLSFVRALASKRQRNTALSYMKSYEKFWLPDFEAWQDPLWFRLHSSLNPTGTVTTRFSSSNPNQQQVSSREETNLRYVFGPAPGREWWSLDAENIELRIPAFVAGETEMIELFEHPDKPPCFGSGHLLMFSAVYPEEFASAPVGRVKDEYPRIYKKVKNGDFAVQYGSVEQSGTADRAYGVKGAFRRVKQRFKRIHGPGGLNERLIAHAEKYGYVETMPDKTVDPDRGYPLVCPRSPWGSHKIDPTKPLNYWSQGTAGWWMMKAMIRCQKYLDELNTRLLNGYYMVMQVHDELVFDFPKTKPKALEGNSDFRNSNLWIIRKIQKLMEQGGDDIGIPTPVSVEYHADTWSEEVSV